jgi:geranylgeranyl reductase family protein
LQNPNPETYDVIVIGAGPAGAMAAIEAAKGGLSVAIIEKNNLPRRKVCAGGLVKRAVHLIPSDIIYPIEQQCHTIAMRTQDTDIGFEQTRENLVTMVCRSSFDGALIKHAKALGVHVYDNTKVTAIKPSAASVSIQSTAGNMIGKYVVFAEGAMAKLSNQFWKEDRLLLPSLEADIYVDPPHTFQTQAVFDFGIIDGGYAWVFPKGDHLSIGLGILRKQTNISLQQSFDTYLDKLGLKNARITNRKGFIIPLSPRKQPMMKQRMVLVGDTAGFADPITAEGLTHAIQSGLGAGQAIASYLDNPDKVSERYQSETVAPILEELKVARLLAKIIYHPNPRWRNMLFKHYGDRLCQGMADLIEGKRTYTSSLKKHKFLNAIIKKASA